MSLLDIGFRGLLTMSVHATLLIAAVLVARRILRRQLPAGLVFGLWLLVASTLMVPWRLPLPTGWGQRVVALFFPPKPMAAPAVQSTAGGGPTEPLATYAGEARRTVMAGVEQPEMVRLGDRISVRRGYWDYAVLIWLYGVAVLLVLRVATVVSFRRRLQRTVKAAELRMERVVERCGAQMGLRRLPTVVTTSLVGSPALFGLWRPRLLMPPGLVGKLDATELQWVVRHELAHLRRRDLWAQAGLQLACLVHWFNPLVWLAARLARHDGELACDAWVMRRMAEGQTDDYGRTLLKVLSLASRGQRLRAAVGILENRRRLVDRIEMIACYRPAGSWRMVAGSLLLVGFLAIGFTQEQSPTSSLMGAPVSVSGENQVVPAKRPAIVQPAYVMPNAQTRKFKLNPELDAAFAAQEKRREDWIAQATLELRAVGAVGGVPVAVIDVYGDPHVVMAGSQLFRQTVVAINLATREVTVRRVRMGPQTDPEKTLRLAHPRKVDFPEIPPAAVEAMVERKQDARSIYQHSLPPEVLHAWDKLNVEGKEAILMSYLRMGLVVDVEGDPDGRFSGTSTSQLFGRRISERGRERMNVFLASLSEEQRKAFHNGLVPMIRFTAPPQERERQIREGQRIIEDQKQVVAGLTPEQRKLYDAWQGNGDRPHGTSN